MATVFLARAVAEGGFERLVALKVLHPHLLSEQEFLTMFLDEARVAAKIHHPNVVAIQDLGVEGDRMYTVMDYVLGDTLAAAQQTAIQLRRGLPVSVVLRVALDALHGLDAAHELTDSSGRSLHVVHRDVTPHNIIMGVDGVSRVTDFGIAKAESRLSFTDVGTLKGKAPYMAPEQFAAKRVDRRADVFSMAITIWEAIALRRCLPPDLGNHAKRPAYRPLTGFLADVPPELDAILARALQIDPNARWRSAGEFADAIERQLRDHIAPHKAVAVFVRAFARAKVEREREAMRSTERRAEPAPTSLRGKSGFQNARPLSLAPPRDPWVPRHDETFSDEELEPPTRVLPPKPSKPAPAPTIARVVTPVSMPPPPPAEALRELPTKVDPRGPDGTIKVLRGVTLLGPGDASRSIAPSAPPPDIDPAKMFVSIPPPSVAPPAVEHSQRVERGGVLRGDTVFDPGASAFAREERESDKAPDDSGRRASLRGDTVFDPHAPGAATRDEPPPTSLLNPDIPRAPKLPADVKAPQAGDDHDDEAPTPPTGSALPEESTEPEKPTEPETSVPVVVLPRRVSVAPTPPEASQAEGNTARALLTLAGLAAAAAAAWAWFQA
jgi:serine/threonine-protein kinase